MRFMNASTEEKYGHQRDESLLSFSKWTKELADLLQRRCFGESFQDVVKYCLALDDFVITRLTEEEKEEQLVFCSQYKATFISLKDELEIYFDRTKRKYDKWRALEYNKVRKILLDDNYDLFKAGKLPKSGITITKDEIKDKFLCDKGDEDEQWQSFMEEIRRSLSLMKSLVIDIENRSMILMSLRKKQAY